MQLPDGTPAVVKQLRTDRAPSASRAAILVPEISSLELLPPHANVVTLLGYCWQSVGVYALVTSAHHTATSALPRRSGC